MRSFVCETLAGSLASELTPCSMHPLQSWHVQVISPPCPTASQHAAHPLHWLVLPWVPGNLTLWRFIDAVQSFSNRMRQCSSSTIILCWKPYARGLFIALLSTTDILRSTPLQSHACEQCIASNSCPLSLSQPYSLSSLLPPYFNHTTLLPAKRLPSISLLHPPTQAHLTSPHITTHTAQAGSALRTKRAELRRQAAARLGREHPLGLRCSRLHDQGAAAHARAADVGCGR